MRLRVWQAELIVVFAALVTMLTVTHAPFIEHVGAFGARWSGRVPSVSALAKVVANVRREGSDFRGLPPGAVCQVHHLRLYELMRAIQERQGHRTGDVCVDCAKRAHDQIIKDSRQ